jgi:hypothetical protein
MVLVNPKTGMTHREAREFMRNQFEEFVNKKNVQVGNLNFAADFVDHGADVPPGVPPGPAGAIANVGGALQKFPDLHVTIDEMDCGRGSRGGAESPERYGFEDRASGEARATTAGAKQRQEKIKLIFAELCIVLELRSRISFLRI